MEAIPDDEGVRESGPISEDGGPAPRREVMERNDDNRFLGLCVANVAGGVVRSWFGGLLCWRLSFCSSSS